MNTHERHTQGVRLADDKVASTNVGEGHTLNARLKSYGIRCQKTGSKYFTVRVSIHRTIMIDKKEYDYIL
jgi:hypothetical protein